MNTYNSLEILYPCFIQPKLNGVSCTLDTDGLLISKTGKYFPAVQKAMYWPSPEYPLIGELYVHGWPLQKIISAVTSNEPNELSKKIEFHVYDIDRTYMQDRRMQLLATLNPPGNNVIIVPTILARDSRTADALYIDYLSRGYEGVVYRGWISGIWKRKPYKDSEYECVNVIEGKGKRIGRVGKFVLKLPDGRTFNCGGGRISYETLKHYFEQPPIGKLITVRYHSTSVSGIPLCPQFISVRDYE